MDNEELKQNPEQTPDTQAGGDTDSDAPAATSASKGAFPTHLVLGGLLVVALIFYFRQVSSPAEDSPAAVTVAESAKPAAESSVPAPDATVPVAAEQPKPADAGGQAVTSAPAEEASAKAVAAESEASAPAEAATTDIVAETQAIAAPGVSEAPKFRPPAEVPTKTPEAPAAEPALATQEQATKAVPVEDAAVAEPASAPAASEPVAAAPMPLMPPAAMPGGAGTSLSAGLGTQAGMAPGVGSVPLRPLPPQEMYRLQRTFAPEMYYLPPPPPPPWWYGR